MTATETTIRKFTNGLGGSRYRELFEILEASNLRPLGKSNTETLLFQYRNAEGVTYDILAFRLGPPPVISFPKSYWLQHSSALSNYLADFTYSERPATSGPVSDSQYSAGQIELNRSTHDRVVAVCHHICSELG